MYIIVSLTSKVYLYAKAVPETVYIESNPEPPKKKKKKFENKFKYVLSCLIIYDLYLCCFLGESTIFGLYMLMYLCTCILYVRMYAPTVFVLRF